MDYPTTPKGNDSDCFYGVDVPDPYRWLDDFDNPRVQQWVAEQNSLSDRHIPRDETWNRIRQSFDDMPTYVPDRLPRVCGSRSFFFSPGGDSNDPALMVQEGDKESIVLLPGHRGLDPELRIYREFVYPSPDGRYVAFAATAIASDMQTVYIWDVDARQLLEEFIPPTINPVLSWLPGKDEFFYNITRSLFSEAGDAAGDENGQADGVYHHMVGADTAQDTLVLEYHDAIGHAALPWVSPDGSLLFVKTINFVTQESGLSFCHLDNPKEFITLFEDGEAKVTIAGIHGGRLFLETTWQAPNARIMEVRLDRGEHIQRNGWREFIAEKEFPIARTRSAVISDTCCLAGDRLFVTYQVDVSNRIETFGLNGVPGAELGIAPFSSVLQIHPSRGNDGIEVALSSFLIPYTQCVFENASGALRTVREIQAGLDEQDYHVSQMFCESDDGARISLFVIRAQSAPGDSAEPVLLYGYGGWGQSISPAFFPDLVAWLRQGGVYVVANIRGGGEYGESWHRSGKLLNKQNVFDDFCCVASFLRQQGIAAPGKLAIRGLSNGGLLTAACVNQRPDLFDAAIVEIPLLDVIHLMDLPVGPAVAEELGDPTADEMTFRSMFAYSPLQNVRPHPERPPVFVVAGEYDERALPQTACKYVAAMQDSSATGQEVLLRIVDKEGHTDWPWDIVVQILSEELSFLLQTLCEKDGNSDD